VANRYTNTRGNDSAPGEILKMTQSSFDFSSERAANAVRSASTPSAYGPQEVRSFVVAAALACGLAAAQLVVSAAPVHAASEGARTAAAPRNSVDTVQTLASFKSNPDSKKASQGKAHGEKKKSTRSAHAAPKKDHDSTKMAKADKKRASDESIGTSDDPLEGL
jgi:hypothetical protein